MGPACSFAETRKPRASAAAGTDRPGELDKDRGERPLPVIGGAAEDVLGSLAPCCLQPLLNYCVSLDKVGKKEFPR